MFYHLYQYLADAGIKIPGAGLLQYISFRAAFAMIASLVISMVIGKSIIRRLQLKQIGEIVRDLGLEGQIQKKGTPTMGGLIILAAILIPTILFAQLDNIYVILILISTVWLGVIGFLDDYIKVFKKNKAGLAGKFKIVGQVGIGLIVGCTLYWHQDVKVREYRVVTNPGSSQTAQLYTQTINNDPNVGQKIEYRDKKSMMTTVPFIKTH